MFAKLFGGKAAEAAGDGASPKEKKGDQSNDPETSPQKKDEAVASHISKMDSLIRRKLHGTGAQYNMKVVIRGERGVGKSTLWRRLQGLPYEEKYTPTPEIQTTTINNWVYRGSRDVVKVEVWDVVDKGLAQGGKGRVPEGEDLEDVVAGLPPDHGSGGGGRSLAVLDAGVVNVYQGASAIIFVVDPYRPETLDKVEKGLAEAPVDLPTVVLLNFRDKLEEDAVAKASQKSGTSTTPASAAAAATAAMASTQSPAASAAEAAADPSPGDGDASTAVGPSSGTESVATAAAVGASEGFDSASSAVDGGGGKGGAWDHVVTLETARLMMDRVKEADEAAGRGAGRRVSLFDCSMKNCFGLRVLYTYLNVPFLELKRKSLLQQAQMASERLEKEYQELAGFIGGHSYGNYMQHLRASDVDPTAGRSAPAAPPGRPSIASMPAAGEAASLERRGSIDSHGGGGRKEKKSKHHKDKDKSKKKDKHRHKSSKSKKDGREEAAPEYGGRVTDAKNFAPVTKKTATDELADFFGESSEGDSDEGLRERRKVVKAINPSALANASAARADDATDSDEMPAPRTSRLKRVTAPTKPIARPPSTAQPLQSSIGVAASSRHQRPSLNDTKASSVAKVTGDVKGKEDVEEEPSAVRDTENDAAEEMEESELARTAHEEEKGDGAEGEQGVAAHGEGTKPVAAGNESGDDADGVSEGKVLSEADTAAAAVAAVVADPSITAGDGTAEGGGGETGGNQGVQAEEEHSQAAGEGHGSADGQDHDEGRKELSRGREQAAGAVRKEELEAEAETAAEQKDATPAKVSSSPAAKVSPVAGKDPPPAHLSRDTSDTEAKENPQEADEHGTAGDDTVVTVDQATDAGDDGDNYTGVPPQADAASEEVGPSAEVDDDIVSYSADTAVDQEAVTVQRNAGDEHLANGDSGPEQEVAAVPEIERAEVDDAVVDEHDETGARGQELSGGESGGELGADVGREAAVVRKMEGSGIDDEPGAKAPEPAVTINDDYIGEGSLGGPVAEDFFAEDVSSGEDDLYPGTATAAGGEVVSAERGVADGDDGAPAGDHPPSPRIIATSFEAAPGGNEKRLGFPPSPVATQRKEAAAVGAAAASGDVGLSEAAKAAVEAALASAQSSSARRSSRSSRKTDDSSSKSRKKKKSHKERRRKDGGSKSGGEDGARIVGGRRSGSVGPSDVDSGEKLSSSKRHHRKSAV
ncbi:RBEL1, Ras superfamily GTPase [Ectocarpus siliculosus]|uniref:RBEL1, Ras superfamily GTPase n=1 Tax=Ectocarpus siliculosus TaxID=2880 RepID=D8LBT7_ECTSI|nr:RBEL1, Ras superfamily GTPase [Ectocarpus siliculosus]|eukprot:CBN76796.1 RBEL1, Ras superfamily GTPase [Ectocarpus siliculosus]